MLPVTIHQALQTVEGLRKGRSTAKERPPIVPVSDKAIEATLTHLSPTVGAMVRLQRLTGMRPQEVVGLRPIDIDMSDPECWVYRPDRHKGEHHERDRIVFIGPRAIEVLRPFLGLDISSHVCSPRQAADEHQSGRATRRKTRVQASRMSRTRTRNRRVGDHYTVGTYRQAIHRACDRADVPRWHPHALRHTAGTAIRGRYGLEGAQAVLGHAELRTTQIYGKKSLDAARAIMREIG
jgi:integrase